MMETPLARHDRRPEYEALAFVRYSTSMVMDIGTTAAAAAAGSTQPPPPYPRLGVHELTRPATQGGPGQPQQQRQQQQQQQQKRVWRRSLVMDGDFICERFEQISDTSTATALAYAAHNAWEPQQQPPPSSDHRGMMRPASAPPQAPPLPMTLSMQSPLPMPLPLMIPVASPAPRHPAPPSASASSGPPPPRRMSSLLAIPPRRPPSPAPQFSNSRTADATAAGRTRMGRALSRARSHSSLHDSQEYPATPGAGGALVRSASASSLISSLAQVDSATAAAAAATLSHTVARSRSGSLGGRSVATFVTHISQLVDDEDDEIEQGDQQERAAATGQTLDKSVDDGDEGKRQDQKDGPGLLRRMSKRLSKLLGRIGPGCKDVRD
ncbi:hypothetical protein BC828DRAFT_20358 [Blastocladiella britannica]|nr:hypothetical protein BC828DRAFT_20358 [Blastocladiella britannica]